MNRCLKYIPILITLLFFSLPLPALVIKIGSIAPTRSPWDKALNEIAMEWEKITGGTVQLKIYPGGITGGELDMIRKMRIGTLGGAVLTNMGITKIDSDVFVLNTPFLIESDEEFRYLFDRMKPIFEKQLEGFGFQVVLWTMAGWVHFFTKEPALYPEEMKKFKISFTTGEPEMEQAWKKMGYNVIPNEMNDLMISLQNGMITGFYLPPLVAGSGQYFALAPHMMALRLSPLVGGLVLTKKSWKSIPEQYYASLIQSVHRISRDLYAKTQQLEKEALQTMKEHGLIIHQAPPDALSKWREAANKGMDELVGKVFSKEIYEKALQILQEYRTKK